MTYEHVGGECLAAKFPGNHVTSKRRVPPNKAHQLRLRSCIMYVCPSCCCFKGVITAVVDFAGLITGNHSQESFVRPASAGLGTTGL